MKIRRLILIASSLVAVAALASWLLVVHWQHSEQTFKILPKLAAAEQRYAQEHVSQGQPLPTSVTLQDLVSAGYMRDVPRDPMTRQKDWMTSSEDLLADPDQTTTGITDVHSSSNEISPFENTPYSTW